MSEDSSVHQRIAELIKMLAKGNQSAFGRAVGIPSGTIAGIIGDRQVKPGFEILQKIIRAYPEVSWDWLMFGTGDMLREPDVVYTQQKEDGTTEVVESYIKDFRAFSRDEPRVVSSDDGDIITAPVVNYRAAANYLAGYNTQEALEQFDIMSFPKFMVRGATHTVFPVVGDSMSPTFVSRDYVWCRQVPQPEWVYIPRDTVCVIVSKTNGLQLKRLQVEAERYFIRCKSDNTANPTFTLDFEELTEVWEVQWRITNNFENLSGDLHDKVSNLEDKYDDLNAKLAALMTAANLPVVR